MTGNKRLSFNTINTFPSRFPMPISNIAFNHMRMYEIIYELPQMCNMFNWNRFAEWADEHSTGDLSLTDIIHMADSSRPVRIIVTFPIECGKIKLRQLDLLCWFSSPPPLLVATYYCQFNKCCRKPWEQDQDASAQVQKKPKQFNNNKLQLLKVLLRFYQSSKATIKT